MQHHCMDRNDIARWVAEARKSRGWTQSQLAEELGLSKANISHWETAKHDPSFLQLLKIRDLTGHPLREVMQAEAWPFPDTPPERFSALDAESLDRLRAALSMTMATLMPSDPSRKRVANGS